MGAEGSRAGHRCSTLRKDNAPVCQARYSVESVKFGETMRFIDKGTARKRTI